MEDFSYYGRTRACALLPFNLSRFDLCIRQGSKTVVMEPSALFQVFSQPHWTSVPAASQKVGERRPPAVHLSKHRKTWAGFVSSVSHLVTGEQGMSTLTPAGNHPWWSLSVDLSPLA
jgi:hypothetical protein